MSAASHTGCVLAIVGSRDTPNYQSESIIREALHRHQPSLVVSGGAIGVDQHAVFLATEMGYPIAEYIPEFRVWDRGDESVTIDHAWQTPRFIVHGGFKQRNAVVVRACECLVRIATPTTKTYGSGHTADLAQQLGKHVERFTV